MGDLNQPDAPIDPVVESMFRAQTTFMTFLEGLDGLIEQTKQRGWTEEQARALVVSVVTGSAPRGPEKPE